MASVTRHRGAPIAAQMASQWAKLSITVNNRDSVAQRNGLTVRSGTAGSSRVELRLVLAPEVDGPRTEATGGGVLGWRGHGDHVG